VRVHYTITLSQNSNVSHKNTVGKTVGIHHWLSSI